MHHDFDPLVTQKGYERVEMLTAYILSIGNPLTKSNRLHNIITAIEVSKSIFQNAINCVGFGDKCYQSYVEHRLLNKTKSIHDNIPANRSYLKIPVAPEEKDPSKTKHSRISNFLRIIDYAKERGFSIRELLKYELIQNAPYLEKCGITSNLKKSIVDCRAGKATS